MMRNRDIWLWLGTAALILAAVPASFAYSRSIAHPALSLYTSTQAWVAYALVLLAFGCLSAAIRGWRFPPWAKVRFPNVEFEITNRRTAADASNNLWDAIRIRITNDETDQPANLTIRRVVKMEPGYKLGETPFDVAPSTAPDDEPPEKMPAEWLRVPVTVMPQLTVSGYHVSELQRWYRSSIADPIDEWLEVTDHTSRKKIKFPIEMKIHNSQTWTACD